MEDVTGRFARQARGRSSASCVTKRLEDQVRSFIASSLPTRSRTPTRPRLSSMHAGPTPPRVSPRSSRTAPMAIASCLASTSGRVCLASCGTELLAELVARSSASSRPIATSAAGGRIAAAHKVLSEAHPQCCTRALMLNMFTLTG